MKLSTITISFLCIFLLSMLLASATTSEMGGGMGVLAENGGYISGVSGPGSNSIFLGDATFTRDIGAGEDQEFDALFANDDGTLGTVRAAWSWFSPRKPTKKPAEECYALLGFKAPDDSINVLLLQGTRPTSISPGQFTGSVTTAGDTWNHNGVVSKTFFGTVTDAPAGTKAQANDGNFVQSFTRSSGSWLAGSWLTSSGGKLTDWDVMYNTRYSYSTDPGKTGNARLRYVDLQAVALHEMGHAVGLDDIYNKADKSWDTSEVMNSYIWGYPRYSFGVGDLAGLKAKYG